VLAGADGLDAPVRWVHAIDHPGALPACSKTSVKSLERQAHRTVLAGILAPAYADPEDAAFRTRALGVPVCPVGAGCPVGVGCPVGAGLDRAGTGLPARRDAGTDRVIGRQLGLLPVAPCGYRRPSGPPPKPLCRPLTCETAGSKAIMGIVASP